MLYVVTFEDNDVFERTFAYRNQNETTASHFKMLQEEWKRKGG